MVHLPPLQAKTSLLFLKFLQVEPPNKHWKAIIHHYHHLHPQFPRMALPRWELHRDNFLTSVLFKDKMPPTLQLWTGPCQSVGALGDKLLQIKKGKLLNRTHFPTTFSASQFYIPLGSPSFYNITEENICNTMRKGLPSAMEHKSVVPLLSSLPQPTSEKVAAVGLHTWML